jgi:hypothetical protein
MPQILTLTVLSTTAPTIQWNVGGHLRLNSVYWTLGKSNSCHSPNPSGKSRARHLRISPVRSYFPKPFPNSDKQMDFAKNALFKAAKDLHLKSIAKRLSRDEGYINLFAKLVSSAIHTCYFLIMF